MDFVKTGAGADGGAFPSGERPGWRADPRGQAYERTRAEILLGAEQAINESGISRLRIGRVSELAGCTRQNIYRYYKSKEDLIAGVLLRRSERLGRHLLKRLISIEEPEDRLLEGLLDGVEIARGDRYLQSYYADSSAAKMTRFIAGSQSLVAAATPLLESFFTESPRFVRSDLTPGEFAECLFRTFVAELMWGGVDGRTRTGRKEFLRKTLIPGITGRPARARGKPRPKRIRSR